MKIKIPFRIEPFSKNCRACCILPNTSCRLTIFATKLIFEDQLTNDYLEIYLKLKSIKDFLIFLNSDKRIIEVSGVMSDGYFRYIIGVKNKKIYIELKKAFKPIEIELLQQKISLSSNESYFLDLDFEESKNENLEKLFLGVCKAQDVELINRRRDLKEIIPIWFYLGQSCFLKEVPTRCRYEGTASLLLLLKNAIEMKNFEKIEELLINIYKTGFDSIFSPKLFDDNFWGIIERDSKISEQASSLILLEEGYSLIRSLFFQKSDNTLHILPILLPIFFCGKILNLNEDIGTLNIEWSQKSLKKMIIFSKQDAEIKLKLQSKIKSFRLRKNLNERGSTLKPLDCFSIRKDQIYYFDRFQK